MSKDWAPAELQVASEAMKASGNMGYAEFCEELAKQGFHPSENTPITQPERL